MDTIIIEDFSLELTDPGAVDDARFMARLVLDGRVFDQTDTKSKESDALLWILPGTFLVPAGSEAFKIMIISEEIQYTGAVEIDTQTILASVDAESKRKFRVVADKDDKDFGQLEFSAVLSTSNYAVGATPAHVLQNVKSLDTKSLVALLTRICISDASCVNADLGMLNALYAAVCKLGPDLPDTPNCLGLLANIHVARYDTFLSLSGDRAPVLIMSRIYVHGLAWAISLLEDAVPMAVNDHPKKPWLRISLCMAIRRSMLQNAEEVGIFTGLARKLLGVVFDLSEEEPKKPILLHYVGVALSQVFAQSGRSADLDNAIAALNEAVTLSADNPPTRISFLEDLKESLAHRFELTHDPQDIVRSLQAEHDALGLTPDSDPTKPIQLNYLSHAFFLRAVEFHDLALTQKSIAIYESALLLINSDHAEMPSILNNLAAALQLQFTQQGSSAKTDDLDRIQTMLADAVRFAPEPDPHRLTYIANRAKGILFVYAHRPDIQDLDQCVSIFRDGQCMAATAAIDKVILLHAVGLSLLVLCDDLVKLNRLDEAATLCEDVIRIMPDDRSEKPQALSDLGTALAKCYAKQGGAHLEKVVTLFENAALLLSEAAKQAVVFNKLGEACLDFFDCSEDLDDLDKSFIYLEKASMLCSPGDQSTKSLILYNLALSSLRRFQRLRDIKDIQKSVSVFEEALALATDEYPNKALWRSDYALALFACFEGSGAPTDLDKAITNFQDSVTPAAVWPNAVRKKDVLHHLACALFHRFHKYMDFKDIDDAVAAFVDAAVWWDFVTRGSIQRHEDTFDSFVEYFRRFSGTKDIEAAVMAVNDAVRESPEADSPVDVRIQNIGIFLSIRLKKAGDRGEIPESVVDSLEAVVTLLPKSHRKTPLWLNMVGDLVYLRFKRSGTVNDLGRSIALFEKAVELATVGSSVFLKSSNHLGLALLARFHRLGDLRDINRAVNILEDAARHGLDDEEMRHKLLNNLVSALLERYNRHQDFEDLNKSLFIMQVAQQLDGTPNADKAVIDANLTNMLNERTTLHGNVDDMNVNIEAFERRFPDLERIPRETLDDVNRYGQNLLNRYRILGDFDDVDKAIEIFEHLLKLVPDGNGTRVNAMQNLSYALVQRFIQQGGAQDITKCIDLLKQAIELMSGPHPVPSTLLFDLGRWLPARYELFHDIQDLEDGFLYLSTVAALPTAPTLARFRAAYLWAWYAQHFQHGDPMTAFALAMELLPELAWIGLSVPVRHMQLLGAGEVVADAVAVAIEHCQYDKAVEWLEQGRSIIWNQINQLRTPIKDLACLHPDLADRLLKLSEILAYNSEYSTDPPFPGKQRNFHDVAQERAQLISEIRLLPGFSEFLLPKTFKQLSSCVRKGPVVMINVSKFRCDALVIVPKEDSIVHIPLEQFSADDANELLQSLEAVLKRQSDRRKPDHSPLRSRRRLSPDMVLESILSKLWLCVAKPILDGLNIKVPSTGTLPRLWWCLTGPLAFLPIHAAGLYSARHSLGSRLSDFVVSSYTPSLSALILHTFSETELKAQILAVALPEESGLPCAQNEIDIIKSYTNSYGIMELMESNATVENVIEGMKRCSFVHFACHGIQSQNAIDSALLLTGDSKLSLSKISTLNIPHAKFAFLSACQTAVGDDLLPEESIHLAAGMLSAGYESVIGTIWSISDSDGPLVAEAVYAHLFRDSRAGPDPTEAALALHLAVKRLQESSPRRPFLAWVPFIHIGV